MTTSSSSALSLAVYIFLILAIAWSLSTVHHALQNSQVLNDHTDRRTNLQHHRPIHIHQGHSRFWHEHDHVTIRTVTDTNSTHHTTKSVAPKSKEAPIVYSGLNHINVVVDELEEAVEFYESVLGFQSAWGFSHFRNSGSARAAGFDNAEASLVDVSIRVLKVPGTSTRIELVQYHSPKGFLVKEKKPDVWESGHGVGHVCLKVKNIQHAFQHLQQYEGKITFPSARPDYGPFQLEPADPESVQFFPMRTGLMKHQHMMADLIGRVSSLHFRDPYGVTWVLDQVSS